MIYLDNAGTTKMFEKCAEVIKEFSCNTFFNAQAGYKAAIENRNILDQARKVILSRLNASKGEVIFTSGATESNNLAIRGSLRAGKSEYVFSSGEHPSVYNTAMELKNNGAAVHFVDLQANGQIDYDKLASTLNENTRLISVIHVSNETGAINDIAKICALRKKYAPKALLHVDGVQAFNKVPVDLSKLDVDLYTISAHKFHGPKGIGALYVKNKSALKAITFGGGQEFGLRSGTENLPAIMAMATAIQEIDVEKNLAYVQKLKNKILSYFSGKEGVQIFSGEDFSPYIISLSFAGINGETLMRTLEDEVIVGIGSACSSKHAGNRVLEGLGFSRERVKSNIRISLNAYISEEEIEKACEIIYSKYKELWEKVK